MHHSAYNIFAQSTNRMGYTKGMLSLARVIDAATPTLDPFEYLTMGDMIGKIPASGDHRAK
jgi:FtsP/CotA-like multicopper oxidase with cupredoxin domain